MQVILTAKSHAQTENGNGILHWFLFIVLSGVIRKAAQHSRKNFCTEIQQFNTTSKKHDYVKTTYQTQGIEEPPKRITTDCYRDCPEQHSSSRKIRLILRRQVLLSTLMRRFLNGGT